MHSNENKRETVLPNRDSSQAWTTSSIQPLLTIIDVQQNTVTGIPLMTMDSSVATYIFRQLLATPSRNCLRLHSCAASRATLNVRQRRSYALRRGQNDGDGGSRWQQRMDAFPKDMSKQLREYPKVTSFDLRNRLHRPRRVRMLARDFIEGQLARWNPFD